MYADNVSRKGLEFIARFEGCVLHPYNDPYNATIGIGHLIHTGRVTADDIRRWKGFTRADALTLLKKDTRFAVASVNRLGVRLGQAQFDALTSFAFNCGGGALNGGIRTYLRERKPVLAMEILKMYVHANGTVLAGLVRRRNAEADLYLSGHYGF